jgi:hypothetical protein
MGDAFAAPPARARTGDSTSSMVAPLGSWIADRWAGSNE